MKAIKSIFNKNKQIQNNPQHSNFDHSKIQTTSDISQCPFINTNKNNVNNQKNQMKQKVNKKNNKQEVQSSSDQEQLPRGGCPFMGGSQKKRNPDLFLFVQTYDEPFVSKFNYYLSSNKIDFTLLMNKKFSGPVSQSRQIFNFYPIYLQHTLFYKGQDYQKVRSLQCCSRFLPYQKLRQKGNKLYNKGKYAEALDYYERALSLFKWLDYVDQESLKSQTISQIQSEKSFDSGINSMDSNDDIKINLKNVDKQTQKAQKQKEQLINQHKQFFIVYKDQNTKLFDGQDMQDGPDIDMRKSLMLQILINMSATYINLNHYTLALRCIEDCFQLSQKVSQVYFRKAQALTLNKNSTIQDIEQAKLSIEKAIQMKKSQKIFQSNQNILRMVNLHKAEEAYSNTLTLINKKLEEKRKQNKQIAQNIYKRAKQINEIELQMLKDGKKPYDIFQQHMQKSRQYKILLRMKQKYLRVIQFYTEAKNEKQVQMGKKQLQGLLKIFAQMNKILNIQIKQENNQLGGINNEKIKKRIQTIKRNYCEDIYNEGKYNFSILQWAIKQIIKQQRQQRQYEKKTQQNKNVKNNTQYSIIQKIKDRMLQKTSLGLILIPITVIFLNNFLLI